MYFRLNEPNYKSDDKYEGTYIYIYKKVNKRSHQCESMVVDPAV